MFVVLLVLLMTETYGFGGGFVLIEVITSKCYFKNWKNSALANLKCRVTTSTKLLFCAKDSYFLYGYKTLSFKLIGNLFPL